MKAKKASIPVVVLLVFISVFISCGGPSEKNPDLKIENGFYLINRVHTEMDSLKPLAANETIIPYNAKYTADAEEEQEYVVVNFLDFVPMTLKEKPEAIEQEDKRKRLLLKLNENGTKRLEDFTGQHVNKRVGTVVGNEILTMHVIREKITGGLMQISRCHDNACEFLLTELEDNVVE